MKGIYAIFKKDTNECVYVGQSKNIERRSYQHLRPGGKYNNHYCKTVEVISDNESLNYMRDREAYWINKLQPSDNIIRNRSFNMPEVTKQKIGKALKGHEVSEVTKQKIGKAHKGKITSEETKEKLRQYSGANYRGDRKGKMTGKIWLTDGYNNIVISETEDIQQYIDKGYRRGQTKRNSLKGRKQPKEVGEKISKKFKNRTLTTEWKQNISESRKETLKDCVLMYKGKHHAYIKKTNVEKYLAQGYTFEKQYNKSK